MRNIASAIPAAVLSILCAQPLGAQSSSLYLDPAAPVARRAAAAERGIVEHVLSQRIAAVSFVAVGKPPPREFAVHDLVTVIVRETITSDAESTLETQKTFTKEGEITEMPRLRLQDILQFQLTQSDLSGREPKIGIDFEDEWEGRGTQRQRNTFTARITARIIDIKPNGTMVLEARKRIQSDNEGFLMIVTGTCRGEDITTDNTVLSTQLFDLNVVKEHGGELRKASKKGVLTKFFEAIFNF